MDQIRPGSLTRGAYLALAITTIVVGLLVHKSGTLLPPAIRDILGDALWAMMIVWWIGVLAPSLDRRIHGALALVVCMAVELSQLIRTPILDAVRRHPIGHLVLGSDFDVRDVVAYTVGVLCAVTALSVVRLSAWQRLKR